MLTEVARMAGIAHATGLDRPLYAEPPLRSRRIAIVGFAETSWPPETIWADAGIEKWTLNHGHGIDARWDRLFEFHDKTVVDIESGERFAGKDEWAVLQHEARRPIYMKGRQTDVPCSVPFDINGFSRYFGSRCDKLARRPYAEMAAAYMLGYAIMLLVENRKDGAQVGPPHRDTPPPFCDQIDIYGFELFDGEEYDHQRACFEMYAGWAMGAGIRLTVPDTSAIFSSRGLYEYDNAEASKLLSQARHYLIERFAEMTKKFHEVRARNEAAVQEMQTISGVMQEIEQEKKFVDHLLKGGNYQ